MHQVILLLDLRDIENINDQTAQFLALTDTSLNVFFAGMFSMTVQTSIRLSC